MCWRWTPRDVYLLTYGPGVAVHGGKVLGRCLQHVRDICIVLGCMPVPQHGCSQVHEAGKFCVHISHGLLVLLPSTPHATSLR